MKRHMQRMLGWSHPRLVLLTCTARACLIINAKLFFDPSTLMEQGERGENSRHIWIFPRVSVNLRRSLGETARPRPTSCRLLEMLSTQHMQDKQQKERRGGQWCWRELCRALMWQGASGPQIKTLSDRLQDVVSFTFSRAVLGSCIPNDVCVQMFDTWSQTNQ